MAGFIVQNDFSNKLRWQHLSQNGFFLIIVEVNCPQKRALCICSPVSGQRVDCELLKVNWRFEQPVSHHI